MEKLGQGQYQESFKYLNAAERLITAVDNPDLLNEDDKLRLMALTYNNLGCYYKKG